MSLLRSLPVGLRGRGTAVDYAEALLRRLGASVERMPGDDDGHPALVWARSGAMTLTGHADGPPRLAAGALAACARGAGLALGALAERPADTIDGAALLGERAACAGLSRQGSRAPGGSCRMLRARDGWIALNLARDADVADLPAWLEASGPGEDPWHFAATHAALRSARALVERARWLGLPAASVDEAPRLSPPWLRIGAEGRAHRGERRQAPLVVDLSTLWAGPLCTQLLAETGARVIKVESRARPDGARRGPASFFDLLHVGADCVALDFTSDRDRARLCALLERADVVVESARPRALAQLGIEAAGWVARRTGLTWLSLTGYGRDDPAPGRVAFGDDAGVAAGLALPDAEAPLFCADAIADPLAGLHAALAARASWRSGGGHLLDVSLRDVAAHAARFAPGDEGAEVLSTEEGWAVRAEDAMAPVAPPRARAARGRARDLGADTEPVCATLALPC